MNKIHKVKLMKSFKKMTVLFRGKGLSGPSLVNKHRGFGKDEKCFRIENPKSDTPVVEEGFLTSMDSPDHPPHLHYPSLSSPLIDLKLH